MKKQACKACKTLTENSQCPQCGSTNLSASWQGRITFLDPKKSLIAHHMGVEKPGEYALKVR